MQRSKPTQCKRCHQTNFETNDQGVTCCSNCGLVLQQLQFDNNVNFGGQKQMEGKNINTNERDNQLSSERRLKRTKQKIQDLRRQLQIDSTYDQAIQAANRLLKYADNCGFFKKGKNVQLYASAALYITLRFQRAPYLLIDFSDKMNVGLFKLARCYLKLSKNFGFQEELPLIDPSLFIHRYCRILNLGEKAKEVAMTAIRLIKRMKRDWMCQGRRPSSLCGAALLIATKIHKINCSTTDICKTVFVCDETIRRRLDQFKQTKVSKLTPEEFERDDNYEEVESDMDPPAFRKARLRSQNEQQILNKLSLEKANKEKAEWDEDIPQEVIKRYSDQIAMNYERASDRNNPLDIKFDQQNLMEDLDEEEDESNHTILDDQSEDNSEIDEKLVFLDEKQQKERKQIWQNQNRAWLDKQASKVQRGEIDLKKKLRKKKEIDFNNNPFDAVKSTSLGEKINQEELKRLLSSEPKIQHPKKRLSQIFDPFKWSLNYNKKQEEDDQIIEQYKEKKQEEEENDQIKKKQEEDDQIKKKQEEDDQIKKKQEEDDQIKKKQEDENINF